MPLAIETLLPSYQSTSCTPRALPVPAAPLLTACSYACAGVSAGAGIAAHGRAGPAEESLFGAVARGQLVGRMGGAAAAVFSWLRTVPTLPLRSSSFHAVCML